MSMENSYLTNVYLKRDKYVKCENPIEKMSKDDFVTMYMSGISCKFNNMKLKVIKKKGKRILKLTVNYKMRYYHTITYL